MSSFRTFFELPTDCVFKNFEEMVTKVNPNAKKVGKKLDSWQKMVQQIRF